MRATFFPSLAVKRVRFQLTRLGATSRQSVRFKTYDAAVIGAGITGLTAAYQLSKDPNCTNVTLYEKSSQVGGWLHSESVAVRDGHVVYQFGPQSIRIAEESMSLLNLVLELGLEKEIVATPKNAKASTNRYIYYPDHLVRLPVPEPQSNPLVGMFRALKAFREEPLFEGVLRSVFRQLIPYSPSQKLTRADESVADFLLRQSCPQMVDNLASAFFHGVYAGDIDRLSAEYLFGPDRDAEYTSRQRALLHRLSRNRVVYSNTLLANHRVTFGLPSSPSQRINQIMKEITSITFRNGMGQFPQKLEDALKKSDKVHILTDAEVTSLSQDSQTHDLTVTANGESRQHNRVIAANPAPSLLEQIRQGIRSDSPQPNNTIRALEDHKYAVSVMVINLYYDNPDLLPHEGFGYLIPRSIPFDQNPERGLGVVFGSHSSAGQDTATGTKLTVMMGGHWWDGWQEWELPDPETAVRMARSLLERHLQITETPAFARARLQKNAIPQYTVGHLDRVNKISRAVREDFAHRLTLAGNWYGGISINDCVNSGCLAASYGVGAKRLGDDFGRAWFTSLNWQDWDLEGGIVSLPVRWIRL